MHNRPHTEDAKRRIAASCRRGERLVPVPVKLERDAAILSKLGHCAVWQFADAADVSEAIARARLRRLYEHGRAQRVQERHTVGWVYTVKA
ncbi:MAG: hypothetical protein ACYDHN_01665 [Solirubrobacteraceae bacterium]